MYISESKKALAPNAVHDSRAKVMLYQFYPILWTLLVQFIQLDLSTLSFQLNIFDSI